MPPSPEPIPAFSSESAAARTPTSRGEKPTDFPYDHDFAVHRALFEACGLPLDR